MSIEVFAQTSLGDFGLDASFNSDARVTAISARRGPEKPAS